MIVIMVSCVTLLINDTHSWAMIATQGSLGRFVLILMKLNILLAILQKKKESAALGNRSFSLTWRRDESKKYLARAACSSHESILLYWVTLSQLSL
jgi:hypothetical protein